jgi:hypothetical protein
MNISNQPKERPVLHPEITAQISRLRHAERLAIAERHHRLFRQPITARPVTAAVVTDLPTAVERTPAHVDRVA